MVVQKQGRRLSDATGSGTAPGPSLRRPFHTPVDVWDCPGEKGIHQSGDRLQKSLQIPESWATDIQATIIPLNTQICQENLNIQISIFITYCLDLYFIYLIISYQIVYYRFYYYYFVFQGMTSIELLINFMYQGLQTRTPNRSVKREGVLVVDRANKNAHLQLALESYSLALVSVITGRKTITLLKREFFDSFTNRFSLSLNVYFRPCF